MTAHSSENHPFFDSWEKALNEAGFQWSKNEYAFLFKETLNKPSFKSISTFFGKLRGELFKESSNLNFSLFIMFSKVLNFFGPELEAEFKPLIDILFKSGSQSSNFFQKHFFVPRQCIKGDNLGLYYKIINEEIESLTENEWLIEIPPWVYAFIFFFDESEKEKLSHKERGILSFAQEINGIDFSAFPSLKNESILCSSFNDLDLALVGGEMADYTTKTIILYQKHKDNMKTYPYYLIDFIGKHEEYKSLEIFQFKTYLDLNEMVTSFLKQLTTNKEILSKENYDSLKSIYDKMTEDYQKKWDLSYVPITFATSQKEFLLIHNSESLKLDILISSQKLYQSLLRTTKISLGYIPNNEEIENGYFTDREYFLGNDIKRATDLAKKLLMETQSESDIKYFHIIQHMSAILSSHEKLDVDDFTKMIYEVDKAAGLTFLFSLYANITDIYDWWLLWRGFTKTQDEIKRYMQALKHEQSIMKKNVKTNETSTGPIAASSSEST